MKAVKFFAILMMSIVGMIGCGETWKEPTTLELIDGKTIICENGVYLYLSPDKPDIKCYKDLGAKMTIPWKHITGLHKNAPNAATEK